MLNAKLLLSCQIERAVKRAVDSAIGRNVTPAVKRDIDRAIAQSVAKTIYYSDLKIHPAS